MCESEYSVVAYEGRETSDWIDACMTLGSECMGLLGNLASRCVGTARIVGGGLGKVHGTRKQGDTSRRGKRGAARHF